MLNRVKYAGRVADHEFIAIGRGESFDMSTCHIENDLTLGEKLGMHSSFFCENRGYCVCYFERGL